jgi:hypothetical protein
MYSYNNENKQHKYIINFIEPINEVQFSDQYACV